MRDPFTAMALADPFPLPGYEPPPSLSRVSSIEALRRQLVHVIEHGTNPMAVEYLKEIARREAERRKEEA